MRIFQGVGMRKDIAQTDPNLSIVGIALNRLCVIRSPMADHRQAQFQTAAQFILAWHIALNKESLRRRQSRPRCLRKMEMEEVTNAIRDKEVCILRPTLNLQTMEWQHKISAARSS